MGRHRPSFQAGAVKRSPPLGLPRLAELSVFFRGMGHVSYGRKSRRPSPSGSPAMGSPSVRVESSSALRPQSSLVSSFHEENRPDPMGHFVPHDLQIPQWLLWTLR